MLLENYVNCDTQIKIHVIIVKLHIGEFNTVPALYSVMTPTSPSPPLFL